MPEQVARELVPEQEPARFGLRGLPLVSQLLQQGLNLREVGLLLNTRVQLGTSPSPPGRELYSPLYRDHTKQQCLSRKLGILFYIIFFLREVLNACLAGIAGN